MPVAHLRPESLTHILASAGAADMAPRMNAQAAKEDLMRVTFQDRVDAFSFGPKPDAAWLSSDRSLVLCTCTLLPSKVASGAITHLSIFDDNRRNRFVTISGPAMCARRA